MELLNISISSSLHFDLYKKKLKIQQCYKSKLLKIIYPALAFSEECSCMVNFPNVLKAKKNNGWNQ
jgi:hypothetical protein